MNLKIVIPVMSLAIAYSGFSASESAMQTNESSQPTASFGEEAESFPATRELSEELSRASGGGPIPEFEGAPFIAKPLPPLPLPGHPVQDNRGYAGAHADSYNSGVIPASGPLGRGLEVHSRMAGAGPTLCSTQHFDARGRVITVCVGMGTTSQLLLLDPQDLSILATKQLPSMGGFYFRMNQQDQVVIPVGDLSVQVFTIDDSSDQPTWRLVKRHDLAEAVPEELRTTYTNPLDIVADWQGNWWFSILAPATVGYIDTQGRIHSHIFQGESIENGLAADEDGVYVASNKKLYGMRAGNDGIEVFLDFPYESGKAEHSISSGSGTTPVLFGNKLIAFGDNADPRPNAIVYRLDDVPDEQRLVCKVPVFKPHRTVLENSFIGYDHSLVIENNMGFSVRGDSSKGEPGFVRIDVRKDLSGCDIVWENYAVRAGTGAKLSTGNGLIYTHELLMNTGEVMAWYITALDFATGKMVWRKYVGSGKQWDNAMLTISIGPDGLLTSGMYAGILSVRDKP